MMNADVKAQWVAALRSGKFRQGRDALRDNGRYCCLGVLCRLYANAHNVKWSPILHDDHDYDQELPSEEVMDWAQLDSNDPLVMTERDEAKPISMLNDDGVPFTAIADIIERQL